MRNIIFVILIGVSVTQAHAAQTNLPAANTNVAAKTALENDPVEQEYKRILAEDDEAQQDIDRWIKDAEAFKGTGSELPGTTLNSRIRQRLDGVKKKYESFLLEHSSHVNARIAYGSFLNDCGEEHEGAKQFEKAIQVEPNNTAALNNLANYYGHNGKIQKAFEYYDKAISLKPDESVYYHNLAAHVYMFRKDATKYYNLSEQEVFDKALGLYQKALKLDPDNFILATDYAQSYYGTNPPRYKEGHKAWQETLKIARDQMEREGVYIHLARIEIKLGQYQDAKQHLSLVTNSIYSGTISNLTRNLNQATQPETTNTPSIQSTQTK